MKLSQLKTNVRKEFDGFKKYIKDISIGQYNKKGVNIGFKKADDVIKAFLDTQIEKSYLKALKDVLKIMPKKRLDIGGYETIATITDGIKKLQNQNDNNSRND